MMKQGKVTDNQIALAIDWLRANEGYLADEGAQENSSDPESEYNACNAVANWLENELIKRSVRKIARDHKVSIKVAREVYRRASSIKVAREVYRRASKGGD